MVLCAPRLIEVWSAPRLAILARPTMSEMVQRILAYQATTRRKQCAEQRAIKARGLAQMSPKELLWFHYGAHRAKDPKAIAAADAEMRRRIKTMRWPPAK